MKTILCFIFGMFLAQHSHSQEDTHLWQHLGTANNKKYYIDQMSTLNLPDDFGIKKVWVKVISSKATINKKVYYNVEDILLYEIKCKANQIRLKQATTYASNGKLLDSDEYYDSFKDAVPESTGETIVKKACVWGVH